MEKKENIQQMRNSKEYHFNTIYIYINTGDLFKEFGIENQIDATSIDSGLNLHLKPKQIIGFCEYHGEGKICVIYYCGRYSCPVGGELQLLNMAANTLMEMQYWNTIEFKYLDLEHVGTVIGSIRSGRAGSIGHRRGSIGHGMISLDSEGGIDRQIDPINISISPLVILSNFFIFVL